MSNLLNVFRLIPIGIVAITIAFFFRERRFPFGYRCACFRGGKRRRWRFRRFTRQNRSLHERRAPKIQTALLGSFLPTFVFTSPVVRIVVIISAMRPCCLKGRSSGLGSCCTAILSLGGGTHTHTQCLSSCHSQGLVSPVYLRGFCSRLYLRNDTYLLRDIIPPRGLTHVALY